MWKFPLPIQVFLIFWKLNLLMNNKSMSILINQKVFPIDIWRWIFYTNFSHFVCFKLGFTKKILNLSLYVGNFLVTMETKYLKKNHWFEVMNKIRNVIYYLGNWLAMCDCTLLKPREKCWNHVKWASFSTFVVMWICVYLLEKELHIS